MQDNIFTEQLEASSKENKNLLIMGDAHLCSNKWNSEDFIHKKMANQLMGTLDTCGLKCAPIGATFISDHCQADGSIAESWLDHVSHSTDLDTQINTTVCNYGSSDHLPVTISLNAKVNRKSILTKKNSTLANFQLFSSHLVCIDVPIGH